MAALPSFFPSKFWDGARVAAAYRLWTFESGTTTPKTVYKDRAGTQEHTNPIILEADGMPPGNGLFVGDGYYTFRLNAPPSAGDGLIDTWDGIASGAANDDEAQLPEEVELDEGQTLVTFEDLIYTRGNGSLYVNLNGQDLLVGIDYTETSTNSITLAVAAREGDQLSVRVGASVNPASAIGTVSELALAASGGAGLVGWIQAGVGAVLRWVQDKLRETVSIADYGAVANDATSICPAVLAAITHLGSRGGNILYPRGLWATAATIPDVANVYHKGEGIWATQVRATGDFPVFERQGTALASLNGGGVSRMTIRAFWNQDPAQRQNSYGIKCNGANGAKFADLVILSAFVGFHSINNYECNITNVVVFGDGTDRNYRGFDWGPAYGVANPNNSNLVKNCIAFNCVENGWHLLNPNGSTFDSCTGEACGNYGFLIGNESAQPIPASFANFTNCFGDSCTASNWAIIGNASAPTTALQFANCWSGYTGGNNWFFKNVTHTTFAGCNGISALQSAIYLENAPITVTGFVASEFNRNNGGFAGLTLVNTSGAVVTGSNFNTTKTATGGAGFNEAGTSDYNVIQGNNFATGGISSSANSKIRNNTGFITEKAGTATIVTAGTSSVVTHGLSVTPTIGDISVTVPGNFSAWITGITSTQFTINIPAQGSNVTLGWSAQVLR